MKPKSILALAAVVVVLIGAALAWWGSYNYRLYQEARGAERILAEQYKISKAQTALEITALRASFNAAEAEKQAALGKANVERQKREAADVALAAEIAKTKAMPLDILAGSINLRIGAGQSWPEARGTLTFTRPGAEATLNTFLTGESNAVKLESAIAEGDLIYSALQAACIQVSAEERTAALEAENRALAEAGWAQADDAIKHLSRSILGGKIKAFTLGVGVGAGTVFILKLAGVIK